VASPIVRDQRRARLPAGRGDEYSRTERSAPAARASLPDPAPLSRVGAR
jgi:hypothetical protein